MNPSPMLLDAAVMLALNTGDYDQTQQAIKILDHNSGFCEGVRESAIETAARIIAKELARYQQMRPRTAMELSEANDKLNEELAEVKRDRDGWKKADVLARIRIGELERERDEAREKYARMEIVLEKWRVLCEMGLQDVCSEFVKPSIEQLWELTDELVPCEKTKTRAALAKEDAK